MNDTGRPICVFWYNMKRMGIDISVNDDGLLHVRAQRPELLTPVLKKEIERRAALLAQLLDVRAIPLELQQWLLPNALSKYDDEIDKAMRTGEMMGYIMVAYTIGDEWYVVAK